MIYSEFLSAGPAAQTAQEFLLEFSDQVWIKLWKLRAVTQLQQLSDPFPSQN